jgi:hypothetical protein
VDKSRTGMLTDVTAIVLVPYRRISLRILNPITRIRQKAKEKRRSRPGLEKRWQPRYL